MSSKKEPRNIDQLEVVGLGIAEPGKKVKHPMFGKGIIEELFEYPDGTNTIRVQFQKHGSKALVPEYANLQSRWF